jgi:hypothetical protein
MDLVESTLMGDRERARLRHALVAYAHRHPQASDTLDGVSGFWLADEFGYSLTDLETVLGELVAEGVLAVTRLPHGIALYSVTGERH